VQLHTHLSERLHSNYGDAAWNRDNPSRLVKTCCSAAQIKPALAKELDYVTYAGWWRRLHVAKHRAAIRGHLSPI
jgi:hypothetical protein